MREKIKEILRNHVFTILWRDITDMLTADEKLLKKIDKEINVTADQILTLLDKEIQEARVELAKNLKSIEYPPSGKEWHFNDGTWTNNITELEKE